MSDVKTSPSRFSRVRSRVRAWPGGWVLWRVGITVVGGAIVAIGIVLLPLPGPGWVIIFAGLGLLATEYAWAAALLSWARRLLAGWTAWVMGRPRWVRWAIGALFLLVLAGIGFVVWWLKYR